jgi:hypothetical protein
MWTVVVPAFMLLGRRVDCLTPGFERENKLARSDAGECIGPMMQQLPREMANQSFSWSPVFAVFSVHCLLSGDWLYSA